MHFNFKKYLFLFVLLIGSFLFFNISSASAATLYFDDVNTGNSDWNTLENWWNEDNTPAENFPTDQDDVFISSNISVSGVVVNSMSVGSDYSLQPYSDITVLNGATFNANGSNFGNINGNVIFDILSYNSGTVTGDATFNFQSYNSGTVTGDATFYEYSYNYIDGNGTGTINNDATFNDSSFNNGTINNNATFNDYSYNFGTITGDATFNDYSYNSGTVVGIAKYNYATGGVITIDGQWGSGTSASNVGIDDILISSWIFRGQGVNSGTITGDASFYNNSYNSGTVTGNVIFNDTSLNFLGNIIGFAKYNYAHAGIITIGTGMNWGYGTATSNVGDDEVPIVSAVFNGQGRNLGNFTGSAIFNDISLNDGIITGSATFNTSSHNRGTISGSAIFNNASYNRGTVTENATFHNTSTNGTDSFTATVSGNAIFLDTTINHRTVTGNACFAIGASNHGGTIGGTNTTCTTPTLTTTNPTLVTEGDPEFTLTTTGTDFLFDSTINWNDTPLTTTYVSSTQLTATVPSSNVLTAGTANITVNSPTLALTSTPQTFTIESNVNIPVLTLIFPATTITQNGATLNGEMTSSGGEDATSRGFNYGLTDSYGTTVTQLSGPYSTGVFTTDLIGLTCGTTYHYRSFAINTAGTGVSADATFVTSSCPSSGSSSGSMSTKTKALKNIIIAPSVSPITPPIVYNFGTTTLRNGSRGESVKELQRFLNAKLNLGLIIDGILGPKTLIVIKQWQKDNGLVVDGLVGPKTKAKMNLAN